MQSAIPSRAKAFFEKVSSPGHGADFLKSLIGSDTPTFESEFLDFKGGHNIFADNTNLQELWAKNLSCFANSDGGVVIFGIDAPHGKAKSLSLVGDIARLRERLQSLLSVTTEPPVQRVEIAEFPDPSSVNIGFVVCFIPSSPWRPHQVRINGQPNQFYMRAADNCVPCSVSMLRTLFSPQFTSTFEMRYKVHQTRSHDSSHNIYFSCFLHNAGPATASEVFALCNIPHSMNLQLDKLWKAATSGLPGQAFLAERSIHPQETVRLFTTGIGFMSQQEEIRFHIPDISFGFSISARNQVPLKYGIVIDPGQIQYDTIQKANLIET